MIAIGALAPRIAFLGGGLPVTVAGEHVGALGTSGGNEDQDIECANVCLAAGFGEA